MTSFKDFLRVLITPTRNLVIVVVTVAVVVGMLTGLIPVRTALDFLGSLVAALPASS